MKLQIAPSILSANFASLSTAVEAVERGGADQIHVDVMDGHFVPNITIGPHVVKALKDVTRLPLDVHLMITDPDRYIKLFVEAGASMLSVHTEAVIHLNRTISSIKNLGIKAGVVINPSTPVSALEEIAPDVDFILVMSVNPGFGGQTFISKSLMKVRAVRELLDKVENPAPIEVDGGIDQTNAADIVIAGAEILVAGNAIFSASDPAVTTHELREAGLKGLEALSKMKRQP